MAHLFPASESGSPVRSEPPSSPSASSSYPSGRDEGGLPSSGDRLLAVLGLFTINRPAWTVEEAAEKLEVSATTAYRYFKRLTRVGLISPVSGASYTLGPAIIQMDRQIQLCDPMLRAARGVMAGLIRQVPEGGVLSLCRLFHDRVMCVHQVMGDNPPELISYERGHPMPLFRGAGSKIILAYLPNRTLKSLFERNTQAIADADLGRDWDEFRRLLAAIRRAGVASTAGDLNPNRVGVAAPIFDQRRAILGSLNFVVPQLNFDDALRVRLTSLVTVGAREIQAGMLAVAEESGASRPRVRVPR